MSKLLVRSRGGLWPRPLHSKQLVNKASSLLSATINLYVQSLYFCQLQEPRGIRFPLFLLRSIFWICLQTVFCTAPQIAHLHSLQTFTQSALCTIFLRIFWWDGVCTYLILHELSFCLDGILFIFVWLRLLECTNVFCPTCSLAQTLGSGCSSALNIPLSYVTTFLLIYWVKVWLVCCQSVFLRFVPCFV